MSYPANNPNSATVAAEIGLAVIACWEAMTAIPKGRSGRILVSVATLCDYRQYGISHVTCSGDERKNVSYQGT